MTLSLATPFRDALEHVEQVQHLIKINCTTFAVAELRTLALALPADWRTGLASAVADELARGRTVLAWNVLGTLHRDLAGEPEPWE